LTSDLENKNRVLLNKERELDAKLKSEGEELQRVESKRKQLQNSVNTLLEQLKQTEKERDELGREVKDLTKQTADTKEKLDQTTNELSELKTRTGIQASELNSSKTALDDENSDNTRIKSKLKELETKSLQIQSNIDTENLERESLLKKNQKIGIGT